MSSLFFSYSHADEALRDELEVHLSMLKRQGVIDTWHDRRIPPGKDIDRTIDINLENADIILLLISPNFIASDYCYAQEMTRAMERHGEGRAVVIPVILRPCDWHDAPFGRLRATPRDGHPVTIWPDRDQAFLDVTRAVREAAKNVQIPDVQPFVYQPLQSTLNERAGIRSSNLRVARNFSQKDRDDYLIDSFDYMARFFENSLTALQERNSNIDTRFRKIDAQSFVSKIYQGGQERSACTIFCGSSSFAKNSISYAHGEITGRNSMNDWVTVDADEQKLFLKPSEFSALRSEGGGQKMTPQGASEYFWSMLMRPLRERR